jgi:ATP-dependent RNA helicase DDX42
MSSKS